MSDPSELRSPTLQRLAQLGAEIGPREGTPGQWEVKVVRGAHSATKILTAQWLLEADHTDPDRAASEAWADMCDYLDGRT